MKRIISLIIILVLLFSLASLASCGNDEQSKSKSPTSSASSKKPVSSEKSDKSDALVSSELSSAEVSSAVSSSVSSKPSSNPSSTSGTPVSSAVSEAAPAEPEYPEEIYNSGTIDIYSCLIEPDIYSTKGETWWKGFIKHYKDVYNGSVNIRSVSWPKWESEYLSDFASNDAPDLVNATASNWPKLASRGMVCSVDQLKAKGVVGLDIPCLTEGLNQVDYVFTYKGQCYTFAKNKAEPVMLFVNENLFKGLGVRSPSEYSQSAWNWEAFEKAATDMTRDLDGDDETDLYGYGGWDANWAVTAAGGSLVSVGSDGKIESTMMDSPAIRGFNNLQNIYSVQKCASNASGLIDQFIDGKLAMIADHPENMYNYLFGQNGASKLSFYWSMVPYPLDTRTNSKNIYPGIAYGWTVSSASNNPQGCINYIVAYKTYAENNPLPKQKNYKAHFSQTQMNLIDSCARNMIIPIYQSVGTLRNAQWDFWSNLKNGKSAVGEVVAAYKPMFDEQIKAENDAIK